MLEHLNRMAVFQAVAEAGSFRGGAKRLGLSPSVVSHHVSQLEAQLQTALFYRTTRRLSLSAAGVELLKSAQRMTEAADAGLQAVQMQRTQPVGKLKISVPAAAAHPSFGVSFVGFMTRYPGIEVDISYADTIVDLAGSDYDIAVRGITSTLPDMSYKTRVFGQYEMTLVVSADYAQARPIPQRPQDLADWAWIEYPPGLNLPAMLTRDEDKKGSTAKTVAKLDSIFVALEAVRAGVGIMPVPNVTVADDLAAGRLVRILPDVALRGITTHLIWPANAGPNSPTRLFLDYVFNSGFPRPGFVQQVMSEGPT